MKIIKCSDHAGVSICAADIIAQTVKDKPDAVLGLATGSSPIGIYEDLVRRYKAGELDFSRVRAVNLDEYVGMSEDDRDGYACFMRTHLFDHINIDRANTHIPSGEELGDERYDGLIRSLGGIDLQLLGIGRNGHIGFNEPGDRFIYQTHKVKLTESTLAANTRFFEGRKMPEYAYTMGIGSIFSAKKIIMVALGADKSDALRLAFTKDITPYVPASILRLHPDFTLIADTEALGGIANEDL